MSKLLYCALFVALTTLLACSSPETSSSPTAAGQAPTSASIPAPTAAPVEVPAPTETPIPTAMPVPTDAPVEVPTPTKVPAPTETPIPTAMPVPTDAPSETTPESGMPGPTGMNDTGLLTSDLSDAELSCLSEIGGPQQLVTLMNSPDLASPQERDALVGCLEHETLLKLFLNGFTDQTGPLSDDTSACVSAGFQNFDLRAMMLANQEGSGEEAAMVQGMAVFLERLTKPLLEQKARADDGTTYGQESLMYVCPALISNP